MTSAPHHRTRPREIPARTLRPGDCLLLRVVDVKPTPAAMGDLWFVAKCDAGGAQVLVSFEADEIVEVERPS